MTVGFINDPSAQTMQMENFSAMTNFIRQPATVTLGASLASGSR